ncbi:uncharacterized protein LOC118741781 isoform X2 [Rhagoletis pomonella]|uniref:uncharacterized protein LOC118741781 isoform X2 n=1 Tax=Rhagoletis pomonella TaxID=28610 RepID=UPI0017809F08|nr:uncharacterized protein LOC118741781 isoform X2 [Rhagoletis pomonella]
MIPIVSCEMIVILNCITQGSNYNVHCLGYPVLNLKLGITLQTVYVICLDNDGQLRVNSEFSLLHLTLKWLTVEEIVLVRKKWIIPLITYNVTAWL